MFYSLQFTVSRFRYHFHFHFCSFRCMYQYLISTSIFEKLLFSPPPPIIYLSTLLLSSVIEKEKGIKSKAKHKKRIETKTPISFHSIPLKRPGRDVYAIRQKIFACFSFPLSSLILISHISCSRLSSLVVCPGVFVCLSDRNVYPCIHLSTPPAQIEEQKDLSKNRRKEKQRTHHPNLSILPYLPKSQEKKKRGALKKHQDQLLTCTPAKTIKNSNALQHSHIFFGPSSFSFCFFSSSLCFSSFSCSGVGLSLSEPVISSERSLLTSPTRALKVPDATAPGMPFLTGWKAEGEGVGE